MGVEVTKSKKEIFVYQRKYIFDLLVEARKSAAKPSGNPVVPNVNLPEIMAAILVIQRDIKVSKETTLSHRNTYRYCFCSERC